MKDYKKILEGVVNIINTTEKSDIGFANICSYIGENFQEHKESEDERIRKILIGYFNRYKVQEACGIKTFCGIPTDNILAWLEKQGEKTNDENSNCLDELIEADTIYQMSVNDAMVEEAKNKAIDALSKLEISKLLGLKKQGENISLPKFTFNDVLALQCAMASAKESNEKLYEALRSLHDRVHDIYHGEQQGNEEPTDKPEPKFKVGDWIITPKNEVLQITSIEGTSYRFNNESHYWEICYCDEQCHLWTIQDAKYGDVLAVNNEVFIYAHRKQMYSIAIAHCFVDSAGGFYLDGEFRYIERGNSVHPATKEQRDTLTKAMADAGYTFDFEKKELKKIEQSPIDVRTTGYWHVEDVEQKPAWSKEDERKLQLLIAICDETKGDSVTYSTMYREMEELKSWLKSLKDRVQPQNTWKPTNEQLEALNEAIYHVDDVVATSLAKLIGDLKKLKE